ncbi:MAG TPA: hypothetical protein VM536_12665 [Chloroflexia bacterium]|nr:hypothetical protein [Chloroflexia bacterium]
MEDEEAAAALAAALANTLDDDGSVDLQYAQASEQVLASDWSNPHEGEAWQALHEAT